MSLAILVTMALQASAAPMPVELNRLEGEWVCRVSRSPAGPAWRRETWRPDGAGRLSGRIRVERSKPGRLMLVEDADVSIAGQSLIYHRFDGLMPYRLSRSDRNETVYEHAGSGNLRWISFRHQPGGRLTVTHRYRNGQADSWTYRRTGARPAPPHCGSGR